MSRYRRSRVDGGTYFFTVDLFERNRSLLVDRIDDLRESVAWVRRELPFHIDAWVVLPDHLHAVWTLPEGDCDYSTRWREIKKRFSTKIPQEEYLSAHRIKRNERGIWQRRFWEHTIRDEADYRAHVDYVHFNPLKHKLVQRIKDWPYSTFQNYVKKGIYSADWCG